MIREKTDNEIDLSNIECCAFCVYCKSKHTVTIYSMSNYKEKLEELYKDGWNIDKYFICNNCASNEDEAKQLIENYISVEKL